MERTFSDRWLQVSLNPCPPTVLRRPTLAWRSTVQDTRAGGLSVPRTDKKRFPEGWGLPHIQFHHTNATLTVLPVGPTEVIKNNTATPTRHNPPTIRTCSAPHNIQTKRSTTTGCTSKHSQSSPLTRRDKTPHNRTVPSYLTHGHRRYVRYGHVFFSNHTMSTSPRPSAASLGCQTKKTAPFLSHPPQRLRLAFRTPSCVLQ